MTSGLKQSATAVIDSHVTGHLVGGATMSAGWGAKILGFIPSNLTEVAACIGGLLSIVLIIKHIYGIQRERLEIKRERMEMANLMERRKEPRRKGSK